MTKTDTAGTPIDVLLRELASPAQRAIQSQGLTTLEELASHPQSEILSWHGIGKTALVVIQQVFLDHDLDFDAS